MNNFQVSPEEKLAEYQEQLAFIQSEISADRSRLAKAKMNNVAPEKIKNIERDITNLELAIDRCQTNIIAIKSQIQTP